MWKKTRRAQMFQNNAFGGQLCSAAAIAVLNDSLRRLPVSVTNFIGCFIVILYLYD